MWNYFSRLFLVTELGKNLGNIPMSRAFTVHLRTFGARNYGLQDAGKRKWKFQSRCGRVIFITNGQGK